MNINLPILTSEIKRLLFRDNHKIDVCCPRCGHKESIGLVHDFITSTPCLEHQKIGETMWHCCYECAEEYEVAIMVKATAEFQLIGQKDEPQSHVMSESQRQVIRAKAVEKWGPDMQMNKLSEELLELALELAKRRISTKGQKDVWFNIHDEIADVLIVLAQLREHVLDNDLIERRIAAKYIKLQSYLNK